MRIIHLQKKNKKCDYSLAEIDLMTGTDFEKYLAAIFKNKGYSVTHIGGTGDYGADLILSNAYERIIVQAKRYNSSVGVKAIQEALGAKQYYKGNDVMVITNNYFTKNAENMAKRCNVTLIDRSKLMNL